MVAGWPASHRALWIYIAGIRLSVSSWCRLAEAICGGRRLHTKVGTNARSAKRREALSLLQTRRMLNTRVFNEIYPLSFLPRSHRLSFFLYPSFFYHPPPPPPLSLKRESMQSKGSWLSLTVGDSGRLRSLSTETLQHMRSFLKEWPQNPHWFGLVGAFPQSKQSDSAITTQKGQAA